jgi:hypothetical protein
MVDLNSFLDQFLICQFEQKEKRRVSQDDFKELERFKQDMCNNTEKSYSHQEDLFSK